MADRAARLLAAFGDRFIGQANHIKSVLTGRQVHLHFDRHGVDALKGNGLNIGDHDLFFFS